MSTRERDTTLQDLERSNRNSVLSNLGVSMSDSISLVIRSADQTRKASVTLPKNLSVEELVQATQQRWNLPNKTSYAVRVERTGPRQLDPGTTLGTVGVMENDVLEVYPILEAG